MLIPYLFERAANQKLSSGKELYKWLTANEDKMVNTLVRNSDSEEIGIIGKNALKQKRAVKMKPSSIYWNGLRTFEIVRNASISLSTACNFACSATQKKNEAEPKTDGETFDDMTVGQGIFALFSPIRPEYDFEKEAAITLTRKEAEFLADKITTASLSQNTLLAFLIKHKHNCNSFNEIPEDILPQEMRHDYLLAKAFSDFIIGAHIRYNIIFSNYQDREMMDEFNSWRTKFLNCEFNLAAVLDRISCNDATIKFCGDFLGSVYKNDLQTMDELIIEREKKVKNDRAKLCKPSEYQYNNDRPVHFYRLDFRFGTAKSIIEDIIKGLEG